MRNVPARGGNAVDGDGVLTRAPEADGEIVWSRHPNGWCQVRKLRPAGDGGKSAGLAEEITYKP